MSKYFEFNKAEEAVREAVAKLEMLKEDEQFQRLVKFKEKAEALIDEYGVTKEDLLAIMGITTTPKPKERKQIHRVLRRWTNPETGEIHEGKNPAGNAKKWIEKFGVENVPVVDIAYSSLAL